MKKLLCLLISLITLFAFVGCGGNEQSSLESEASSEQTMDSKQENQSDTDGEEEGIVVYFCIGDYVETMVLPEPASVEASDVSVIGICGSDERIYYDFNRQKRYTGEVIYEDTALYVFPENWVYPHKSTEEINKIRQDFITYQNYKSMDYKELRIANYLGEYEGYVVLNFDFGDWDWANIKSVTVAEYTFTSNYSDLFCAYKDGEFYGLANAYAKGLLTKETIDKLYQNYVNSKNSAFYLLEQA